MVLLLLILCVAFRVSGQTEAEKVREIAKFNLENVEVPRSKTISKLAYVGGQAKDDAAAAVAIRKEVDAMIRRYEHRLKIDASLKGTDQFKFGDGRVKKGIESQIRFLKSLKLEKATTDAVAFSRVTKAGKTEVVFGFRGTAKLRDLIPDAQILVNAKNMKRMDEARAFTKAVLKKFPTTPSLSFYGHSLGGFIAEGVRNGYVGARAVTIHAGVPRWFGFGKGPRTVNAWGKYQKQAEEAFDAAHRIQNSRTSRIVTYGDKVSGKLGVANGKANILNNGRSSYFNMLKNHALGADPFLETLRGDSAVRRPSALLSSWNEKNLAKKGVTSSVIKKVLAMEKTLHDPTLLKRFKLAAADAAFDAKVWLATNSVKKYDPIAKADVSVKMKMGPVRSTLHHSYVGSVKAQAAAKSGYAKTKEVVRKMAPKVKTGAKVAGKLLGKTLFLANAGHVAVESTKDYVKLQEQLEKTGKVDHALVRSLVYAPTDLVLGKGTTELLVNGTKKAYSKMKAACKESGAKCRESFVKGAKVAGSATKKGLVAVGKALHKCGKDVLGCGKKIGGIFSAIGGAVKKWGKDTYKFGKERLAEGKKRREFCKLKKNTKKCQEEDELAELNRARGWKEYRDNNKVAAVAYKPVGWLKSAYKSVTN